MNMPELIPFKPLAPPKPPPIPQNLNKHNHPELVKIRFKYKTPVKVDLK